MPQIKQLTADGQAAVLNLPNKVFPVKGTEGDQFLGNAIEGFGQNVGAVGNQLALTNVVVAREKQKVIDKLQKEQDNIDTVKYGSQIDASVQAVEDDLTKILDPRDRPQAYVVQSKAAVDSIIKTATDAKVSPMVLRALQEHATNKAQMNNVRVQHTSEMQWGQQQIVDLNNNLEVLSNEAAMHPQDRAAYEQLGIAQIRRSTHFTDEKHRGETEAGFLASIPEKQMKMMAQNGYSDQLVTMDRAGDFKLVAPDKRALLLREASNNQHAQQVRVEQQVAALKQEATQNAYAAADHDKLTLSELDANTMITPEHKHAIAKILEDPTFVNGNKKSNRLAIDNLAARWSTEANQTPELAKKYLGELNKLRENIGGDLNKKDMERLTAIGEMLHSNSRAERGVQASEATKNVTGAINDFKSQVDAHKPGESSFNVKYKNLITKSEAEIRSRVGAGEDRNKVVQDIIKRFENRNKNKPADAIDQLNKKDYMR